MAKLYLKKNVTLCYVYSLFCNLTLHHPIHLGPHYLVTMEFLIAVNLLNAIKSNPGMINFPASTSLIFLFIDTHTVNFYFSCETQTFIEHILSANICVCANVQIAKFRLKVKKVGKTTRPFRYDLNQLPYDYTVGVRNRFKGLDLIDRVPDELWTEVPDIVQETGIKTIPIEKK